ncbi:GAF and ANTAR domain-containing protein [Mycobacterium asiaticum]|uniref:GAF and ANTAR domain-containing protein n=1 Tax=Mycobacterium asiaticum TaxID=1790 RepID=UPI000A99D24E|nr:GAF and ANTAR domain-containing protein [Mycobacterium asiaticum]
MIDTSRNGFQLEMAKHMRTICERYGDDVNAFVYELVSAAVHYVPAAKCAGITVLHRRGQLQTAAAIDTPPAVLDALQKRYAQGPALDAARGRRTIRVDDLATDGRWPLYRRDALARTSVRSQLSLPLVPDQHITAALSVFAERPRAFGAEAGEIVSIFAIHGAFAWGHVRAQHQLHRVVTSHDMIGQAKGVLMERYDVNDADAFVLLKRLSEESRLSVAEVSRRLTAKQPAQHLPVVVPSRKSRSKRSEQNRKKIREASRC